MNDIMIQKESNFTIRELILQLFNFETNPLLLARVVTLSPQTRSV